MSTEISTAYVKQYSANIFHLSQQKGSKLRKAVRHESVKGESAFFDRIGSVAAVLKTSRHDDTPQMDTPHSRRRVSLADYVHADLVDNEDKIRTIFDPANPYAQAAVWALGRSMDDVLIAAALGSSYGGVDGGTPISLPSTQKVAAFDGTTITGVNMNVKTLRAVKKLFDANDVDESIKRYLAFTSSQLQALLGETEVSSADFNTIRALVNGEINTFLGFEFIRLERLPRSSTNITYNDENGTVGSGDGTITAANSRRCFAWAQDGLLLALGMDVKARISERDDKHYSTQVYASMSIGATRMEEVKVVEIVCSE